ncbi:IPT/TIG domain-containing protein [Agromyces badenianii]|uniref:IPT/TIG domain-containing protein n=1 Tax=Agromyces badenianii TaxID=2080742 RepID=UPI000D59E231|nr:IPT/TIG domain-containing protein [Agromyces badenianii]PWC05410.1 hypothetical protein DCE94_03820 [Agromyces badenianii]
MADHTLYDTTVPSEGSVALAHEQILRYKIGGSFVNITGDINNLLDAPTGVYAQREVYGTKGTQSRDKIGDNHVITFTVEGVRNALGMIVQPWLVLLLNQATKKGAENKGEFQVFDALDDTLPAFEGTFSVDVVRGNTGYADKGIYNFTLTSDGVVKQITSPIAGPGVPIIESVTQPGLTTGDQLVIRGYKLAGTTGVTIDGQTVTEFVPVDGNTLVILIPASVSGAAPVIVTNASGASAAYPYVAA